MKKSNKHTVTLALTLLASTYLTAGSYSSNATTLDHSPIFPGVALSQPPNTSTDALAAYGRLPLSFEANQGQSDPAVTFLSRGPGYTLFLTPSEAVLSLPTPSKSMPRSPALSTHLRMTLRGAQEQPRVTGLDVLPGKSHYLLGSDPDTWKTDIAHYAKVKYQSVYPGIDLIYHGKQQQLEYDFIVAPGANPAAIELSFSGADGLVINAQGDLLLDVGGGIITQRKPLIYQEIDGQRNIISGGYTRNERDGIGFTIAQYDHTQPLIIDPVLAYSTYLGGDAVDYGFGIAVDNAGNAYLTGQTYSLDFPPVAGAIDGNCGTDGCAGGEQTDVFIGKLNSVGSALVYSTFLGGNGLDAGDAIAVDANGSAYVAGITASGNFPTVSAFDSTCGTDGSCGNGFYQDVFVAKLTPDGSALSYSTYLGGNDIEGSLGLALMVSGAGEAILTGETFSDDFPTLNPRQSVLAGSHDVFVTRLTAAGNALVYSTYLGGKGSDYGTGICLDSVGNIYITGVTNSTDFPTTINAFDRTANGLSDVFAARFSVIGNILNYSTYLGGDKIDIAHAIAVNSIGNAHITGATFSDDFPTLQPFQATRQGAADAFVSKLSPGGSRLLFSTYLGGAGHDSGLAIGLDNSGGVYVAGTAESVDFPLLDPIQAASGGGADVFISRLTSEGNALVFSSYLGGSGDDGARDMVVTGDDVYLTGETLSADFPITAGSLDDACGADSVCNDGAADGFVSKLANPTPAGILQFSAADYSVDEEAGVITITVRRGSGSRGVVSVNYATGGGTAQADSDYGATTGTITFANGDVADKTFTVPITYNIDEEPTETVNLALSNPTGGAVLGERSSALLSIIDTRAAVQFSAASSNVNEEAGNVSLTVNRTGGRVGVAFVDYAINAGTAQAGLDYGDVSGTITFADGDTTPKTITVPILDDAVAESNEAFEVILSNPSGVAHPGEPSRTTVKIIDTDITVQFSGATYSAVENGGNAIITVTRSGAMGAVMVDYATGDGSATAGTDYSARTGTINLANGDTSKTISIPIFNDAQVETDETFSITLSNPGGGATLGAPSSVSVTIISEDVSLQYGAANYSALERDGNIVLSVTRNGSSVGAVTVNYATVSSAAQAGPDYEAGSGVISFADGDTTPKTITIPIIDDAVIEPNEGFLVTLSSPGGGARLAMPSNGVATIVDDDTALRFGSASYGVAETAGQAPITVTRTGSSLGSVSVSYASANDTALADADYTATSGVITFADGDTAQKTFSVPIINDTTTESNERLRLTLSNPGGGATLITPNSAFLTIVSEDVTLQFTTANYYVNEGGVVATFTVFRSGSTAAAVSVDYASADGTASAGQDYTASGGTISFAAGDNAAKTFTAPILNDTTREPHETFVVTLSNPTGGAVLGANGGATLHLTDND